jgi:glyoxylase-like metal-dependent hydrolase (beta-lactamase superfamily II)
VKNRFLKWFLVCTLLILGSAAGGEETLRLQAVNDQVYAIVGPLGNRTPENHGNNATFGFVVTGDGVVLIDAGGSYRGAAAIEAVIRQVTKQPVKVVINTGGQDHRWLGNGYFKARGARIIANRRAVVDQRARLKDQLFMLGNLIGAEGLEGTEPAYADEVFDNDHAFELGGIRFELYHADQAHTPGDSVVWLPKDRVVFSGDIVYVERMLGVMPHSNSRSWIGAFESMAGLQPAVVVPGHGNPTDLVRAKADTLGYLVFLREAVGAYMEEGGDITQIGTLDQSRFDYLNNYETLKGRNAQQVFQEMEWE